MYRVHLQCDGQSITTQYALDNGQTLLATAGEKTTAYLYGLGVIGELTDTWSYALLDGSNTTRQQVDANGTVTLAAAYTPWGDTLSVQGTGSFTNGYLGGLMDAASGLLYVGNGQYYDPQTGRFLTRDARPNQTNPYVPWQGDPTGAMLAPIALLAMVYGRKKQRGKWDSLVILLVLFGAVGLSLSACSTSGTPSSSSTLPPTLPTIISVKATPQGTTVSANGAPIATSTAVKSTDGGDCTLTFVLNAKSGNAIYLTFDDGPDGNITQAIAQLLQEHTDLQGNPAPAHATFFVTGQDIDANGNVLYPRIQQHAGSLVSAKR